MARKASATLTPPWQGWREGPARAGPSLRDQWADASVAVKLPRRPVEVRAVIRRRWRRARIRRAVRDSLTVSSALDPPASSKGALPTINEPAAISRTVSAQAGPGGQATLISTVRRDAMPSKIARSVALATSGTGSLCSAVLLVLLVDVVFVVVLFVVLETDVGDVSDFGAGTDCATGTTAGVVVVTLTTGATGGKSSLTIVTPSDSPPSVAFVTPDSEMPKCSSASTVVSPMMLRPTSCLVSPGWKVTFPLSAM